MLTLRFLEKEALKVIIDRVKVCAWLIRNSRKKDRALCSYIWCAIQMNIMSELEKDYEHILCIHGMQHTNEPSCIDWPQSSNHP